MANTLTYQGKIFAVGDTIKVGQKIQEDDKTRIQFFEGILMGVRGQGNGKSFRVRKISHASVGVERIWPVKSPMIDSIALKKKGSVRRAKLYYLRGRIGKQALQTRAITETPVSKPKVRKTKPATPQSKTSKK